MLLEVTDLKKHFPIRKGVLQQVRGQVKAVDGVTFDLRKGETLSIVGESGCGKTTAGRSLLRLLEPTAGRAVWHGDEARGPVELFDLSEKEMRSYRRDMQIIFQDPYASLNPRITVGNAVGEALKVHGLASGRELEKRVASLLERVGLRPEVANRYPHEFSGGQRQRVGIARALALEPKLIVCDEAVSALDVSIQAQVINLLKDLQDERGISYIFIAHDLSVVKYISDRVAVMYLGRIVETGETQQIFEDPQHPYTKALLSAIPTTDPTKKTAHIPLSGDVPSPINPPAGCHFHTRCSLAEERCRETYPENVELGDGHRASCHLLS
jgi:oligopeptide/dipeptide ABC transporter ATP-binding protein